LSLILDASLAVSWFFADQQTAAGQAVLDSVAREGAVVPSLWRLEVANALQSALRRRRIDAAYRDACLADLAAFDIAVDPETDARAWNATLRLAEAQGLTVYDAAYLELAHRRLLPLATLDGPLAAAARGLGVTVLESGDPSH
jgi:predicted nucleic acid-binding protein